MKRASHFFVSGSLTLLVILILASCTTSDTGRRQLTGLVSKDQETQLGLTAFEQMKKEMPISKDAKANALVAKVGARIAAQAKDKLPDAKWEFVVFESKEANAFCLPGGKVGVYTGILPITKTEAGLATVIGHEVAHASQRHGAERMSGAMAVQGAGQVLGATLSGSKYQQAGMLAYGVVGKYGVELPFSRTHESEADHVGLLYMARAGYDPMEAVLFWERFAAVKGGKDSTPSFLRTHPVDAKRIADLKGWMPEARAAMPAAK